MASPQQNPYGGLPMDQAAFMRYGGARLNPVMNIINPLDVPASLTNTRIQAATQVPAVTAPPVGAQPQVYVREQYNPNRRPVDEGRLQRAIQICEAVKSVNCAAFKNRDFAANCVMAHAPGTNSNGEQQLGGFVLFEEERISQQQSAAASGRAPAYQATIGTLPLGKVSTDEASCIAMTESEACARGKHFGIRNCASCQDGSETWHRVSAEAVRESGVLILTGSVGATYKFIDPTTGTEKPGTFTNPQQPVQIELPADAEGKTFRLIVAGNQPELFVAGLLEGPTVSGKSSIDLAFITTYDTMAGAKPRFIGSVDIREGEFVNKIRGGIGKNALDLQIYVPYTYLAKTEEAANQCAGGPFITKEASAKLLSSDPCFKATGPGTYNMACLKDRFISAGCSASGEAYPSTEAKANALRMRGNQPQDIGAITGRINTASIEAATGRGPTGERLSIEAWDQASRFCTGKRILSPCDADPEGGPVSNECLAYLYANGGRGKREGETYTLPSDKYSSLTSAGLPNQCTPRGTAAPTTDAAQNAARSQGSIANVKKYYDNIHRRANDNTLSDAERKDAMQQCYGITFANETRTVGGATSLADGKEYTFRGAVDNSFMRHSEFILRKNNFDGSDLFKKDGTFREVAPLCGLPGFVSLQSVNYPDRYIVNDGDKGAIRPLQKTAAFEDSACWKMQSCGAQGAVRLENRAGKALISRGTDVFVSTPETSGPDSVNACWQRVRPMTSGHIDSIQFGNATKMGSNAAITNKCGIPGFDTLKDVNEAIRRCQDMPDCTHLNFYGERDMGRNNVVYRNCKGIEPELKQGMGGWVPYSVKPNML